MHPGVLSLKTKFAIGLLVATVVVAGCSTIAQKEDRAVRAPQVMLVSSFDLANNNRDLINLPIEDVLVPRRQAEIEQRVDNLARWRPTKVVVEWDRADQAGLDRRYAQYLSAELQLSAKEQNQIGFRLAEKLGHRRIYAADWNKSFAGESADYDFLTWVRENGQGARLDRFVAEGQARLERQAETMRSQSIVDWYYDLNRPDTREHDHRQYFEIATFGDNSENPGAAWVGGWYGRNLRIFNNIRDVAWPNDRVLVLYGSGHVYLLDRFFRESDAAILVDSVPYIRR